MKPQSKIFDVSSKYFPPPLTGEGGGGGEEKRVESPSSSSPPARGGEVLGRGGVGISIWKSCLDGSLLIRSIHPLWNIERAC